MSWTDLDLIDVHTEPTKHQRVGIRCGKCGGIEIRRYAHILRSIKSQSTSMYWCYICWRHHPDYKNKHSAAIAAGQSNRSKRMWLDPAYRKLRSQQSAAIWRDDNYRTKQNRRDKSFYHEIGYCSKMSAAIKIAWVKHRDKYLAVFSSNDYRRNIAMLVAAKWHDLDYRHFMLRVFNNKELTAISRAYYRSETYRLAQAKRTKALWLTPSYRAAITAATKRMVASEWWRELMADVRSCQPRISSLQHKLYEYLQSLAIEYHREGPETKIAWYNFDCLIPRQGTMQKHLLIECQGDYWHSLDNVKVRDNQKFTYINKYFPEYEIMYVWEHEFLVKDGVVDRLKLKCGLKLPTIKFSFDSIQIKSVSSHDANNFIRLYHYLTPIAGNYIGAFIDDKLIGLAVCVSPQRQNKDHLYGHKFLELARFCIHPAYHVKNFASWFLARIVKSYKSTIVAYADTTIGHSGTIYKAANFKLHHVVPSDYWYVDNGGYVMHKKTLYNHAVKLGMTENEFAVSRGYRRRYGGQKLAFIYENK
jgi:hypothetical protein